MLKQVTVNIIVDDHNPEKCGECEYLIIGIVNDWCQIYNVKMMFKNRCQQCLEEAK